MPRSREDFSPYRALRILAEGGTATVHEAVQIQTGERVALKVLHTDLSNDPEWCARLLNEARLAGRIQHPGVLKVCSIGESSARRPYLVLELLRGQTLAQRLAAAQPHTRSALREALELGAQAADILVAAHAAGIVHRDLTPSNLFLEGASANRVPRVRLLDLGLARELAEAPADLEPEAPWSGFGSIGYVAPEQIRDPATAGERADVYSLGAILFEVLAGCRPFACEREQDELYAQLSGSPLPLSALAPSAPPRLIALIVQMLSRAQSSRPDMSTVRAELLVMKATLQIARTALPPFPTGAHTGRCDEAYTGVHFSMVSD